jgi:hypothetical protein
MHPHGFRSGEASPSKRGSSLPRAALRTRHRAFPPLPPSHTLCGRGVWQAPAPLLFFSYDPHAYGTPIQKLISPAVEAML